MKRHHFLSALLAFMAVPASAAEVIYINSEEEFDEYYGFDDTGEARRLTHEIFEHVKPFMGENGKTAAIAAGYLPFTDEAKYHGYHWYEAKEAGKPAIPNRPAGLNFDKSGRMVAVFWSTPRFSKDAEEAFEPTLMAKLAPDLQRKVLDNFKSLFRLPIPDFLDVFPGPRAEWHFHENVIIENIGAGSIVNGVFDPSRIVFRQGVAPDRFFGDWVSALRNPRVVAAPFERDESLGAPYFNTYFHAGFNMVHLWLGAYNPDGMFAGTHLDLSLTGREEHESFEDPSIPHHHDHDVQGNPAPVDLLTASRPPAEVAEAALAGRFAPVRVPGGTALCSALKDASLSAKDVATFGAVFGMVARRDLAGTYVATLHKSLLSACRHHH